jgi:Protein of unknown function (DUF3627)
METNFGTYEEMNFNNTPFTGSIIRLTPDKKYASVIDFIGIVSDVAKPRNVWASIKKQIQTISAKISGHNSKMLCTYHFPGKRQHDTPVITAQGIIELLYLIPGRKAQSFRRYCGEILIRFMGGDQTLIDEINLNTVKATQPGTPQSFFNESVNSLPMVSQHLKQYTSKLEVNLYFRIRQREETEKDLEISRKRHLLQVDIDEHEIQILAKRAIIDILQLEAVKDDISYRPKRNELMPKITIVTKNEVFPLGSKTTKYQEMPFLILRCQHRAMDKAISKLAQTFPNMKIILDRIYHPNPIVFFSRFQESIPIERCGNHFNIIGKGSLDEKTDKIKTIYEKLTKFNIGKQYITLTSNFII